MAVTSLNSFLEYRPWRGLRNPVWMGAFAITRESLKLIFTRKVFWVVFSLAVLNFLLYFFGQYLFFWVADQQPDGLVRVGGFGRANQNDMMQFLRSVLKMDGSPETFRNFINLQSRGIIVLLVLAGASLLGEDLNQGSLIFYQAKSGGMRNYIVGKFLAASFLVHLFATVPALFLFLEICFIDTWTYLLYHPRLLFGIIGYGFVINIGLVSLLFATVGFFRSTIGLIMCWAGVFFLLPSLCAIMIDRLRLNPAFRVLDFWYCVERLGEKCLGASPTLLPGQTDHSLNPWLAVASLGFVFFISSFLTIRIYFKKGVES